MGLPSQVEKVRMQLKKFPQIEFTEIAEKLLIPNDPELCHMWATLENHSTTYDDQWVWGCLYRVRDCLFLPRYHNLNKRDRKELISDIQSISKKLVEKLCTNNLDATVIHSNGTLFNGFFLYEDFGESNQWQIDNSKADKLLVSYLITRIAERATEKINQEPLSGKIGKNYQAIRFIRMMISQHQLLYKMPLNKVVVSCVNALFGTMYSESDVSNLINRKSLQS